MCENDTLELALNHASVINNLCDFHAVLPARFGTFFSTMESLEREVYSFYHEIVEKLEFVERHSECVISERSIRGVSYDPTAFERNALSKERGIISGRDFLCSKRVGKNPNVLAKGVKSPVLSCILTAIDSPVLRTMVLENGHQEGLVKTALLMRKEEAFRIDEWLACRTASLDSSAFVIHVSALGFPFNFLGSESLDV